MKSYITEMVDLTGDSYLNPAWPEHQRPENWITSLAVHHDAQSRPHDYDSVARYKAEASLHYQELGPGLMYHYKIDNTGVIFKVRPHTLWLHAVGSQENTSTINICLDGYFHPDQNQVPTLEQYEALKELLDWLSTQNPQFSAAQSDVFPHRHFSATACCGDTLVPFVDGYRLNGGNVAIPNVPYDWPSLQPDSQTVQPPSQPALPVPTPASPADSSIPTIEVNYRVYSQGKQIGAYKVASNAVNKFRADGGDTIKDGNGVDVTDQLIHVVETKISPDPIVLPPIIATPPVAEPSDPSPQPVNGSTTVKPVQDIIKTETGNTILNKIISALEGKKTYIGIGAGVVYSILIQLGLVESNETVWTAILGWTGVAFRLAAKK